MNIFIVGGSGRVGLELAKSLSAEHHNVTVGSRSPEKIDADGFNTVKLDLTQSVSAVADAIGKVDAVYFVAGSRGKDLLQIDAFGAVKTMLAAEKNNIKRYIMLSAYESLNPDAWEEKPYSDLKEYYEAKYLADKYLMDSTKLDWTILQAVALEEEEGNGKGDHATEQSVAIPDVGLALAQLVEQDNTIGKVLTISNGDKEITSLFKDA